MSSLWECVELYQTLLSKDYLFTLENNISFKLFFNPNNFVHLLGLEKLRDITYFKNNSSGNLFKLITEKQIDDSAISKSQYYSIIKSRIDYFKYLPDLLTFDKSNKIIVDFDFDKLPFTTKLHNTKFILYKRIGNVYIHLTIGNKKTLYPETFIVEQSSQYLSEQTMLDILNIEVRNTKLKKKGNNHASQCAE